MNNKFVLLLLVWTCGIAFSKTDAACKTVGTDSAAVIKKKCVESPLYGKSVAVFGGSLSVKPESASGKKIWKEYMDFTVHDEGIGGYGFSSLQGSIQNEVDRAGVYDVYILWASTNDFTNNRQPGKVNDYTAEDGYDEKSRETQCGGINYCIRKIREKNPKAVILFFTSLPCFFEDGGYKEKSATHNKSGYNLYDYVKLQIKCCKHNHIRYLDQWALKLFNEKNHASYYKPDRLHLTEAGYRLLAYHQLHFFIDK